MFRSSHIRQTALAVCLVFVAATAFAQTKPKPYEPQSGQEGKDVVWVPTPQVLVEQMLDMAKVTPKDVVMDLGSGDGRTVITAAKRGARAIGVEFNPKMVELSNHNATEAGVTDKVRFIQGDLFEADLSQASVITLFLLPQINLKLRPKILDLKPGTRVVSNSFTMDDWEADQTETISENCTSWCTALMWIVPAKVEGTWTTPQGDMQLQQNFQMVTGTLGGQSIDGRLRGNELTFTAAGTKHTVSVSGNTMQGGNFKATRK
jgi:precorrin-6B methylase 2